MGAFEALAIRDLISALALGETVALMQRARLVVSHDTGAMHLAPGPPSTRRAVGPTIPSRFVRVDAKTVVIWGGEHLACRPCHDGRELATCSANVCMTSIALSSVIAAARTFLQPFSRAS